MTVSLVLWTPCPHCDGDEGSFNEHDEWVPCEFCGGNGGLPDLTPEQRDVYLAGWREWMGRE